MGFYFFLMGRASIAERSAIIPHRRGVRGCVEKSRCGCLIWRQVLARSYELLHFILYNGSFPWEQVRAGANSAGLLRGLLYPQASQYRSELGNDTPLAALPADKYRTYLPKGVCEGAAIFALIPNHPLLP